MRQRLFAAFVPGVVLFCAFAAAMSFGVVQRWRHQADVPDDLAFAAPVIRTLQAHHIRIVGVYRASHYEANGIRAAGLKTDRGLAFAMQVPDAAGARETVEAISRSFGTSASAAGDDRTVLVAESGVLRALR